MAEYNDDRQLRREPFDSDVPSQSVDVNENPEGRLDFEKGLERGGRIGDPADPQTVARTFPDQRVRQAGRTGGETVEGDVTDDDLSPESLIDEPGSTPAGEAGASSADSRLTGSATAGVGLGKGRDEAELADSDPVGVSEALRRKREIREHAADPNSFEPSERAEIESRNEDALRRAEDNNGG